MNHCHVAYFYFKGLYDRYIAKVSIVYYKDLGFTLSKWQGFGVFWAESDMIELAALLRTDWAYDREGKKESREIT